VAETAQLVDVFYKEAIGNPTAPYGFTLEYPVLKGVPQSEAQSFIAAFNWVRAVWRTEPASKAVKP
jgi:hypothetical protein